MVQGQSPDTSKTPVQHYQSFLDLQKAEAVITVNISNARGLTPNLVQNRQWN